LGSTHASGEVTQADVGDLVVPNGNGSYRVFSGFKDDTLTNPIGADTTTVGVVVGITDFEPFPDGERRGLLHIVTRFGVGIVWMSRWKRVSENQTPNHGMVESSQRNSR
jgi:hypothetical protein